MSNLEKLISEWRKQMLAAGVKAPEPLDELESHLREEIDRQMRLGVAESDAFNDAAQKIGRPADLKNEFRRAHGFWRRLTHNRGTRTDHIFGPIWLFATMCSLIPLLKVFLQVVPHFQTWPTGDFVTLVLGILLMGGGVLASCATFFGVNYARMGLKILASMGLALMAAMIFNFGIGHLTSKAYMLTLFNLVTICFLRPPVKAKLAHN